ncbi:MAG: hypothetical protein RBQ97_10055 [Acholeplasma sp.]|nr:hypothetical protein [Acholeplasma sp.]
MIKMIQDPTIINIIHNIFLCSRNLFLVKCIVTKTDLMAEIEIQEDLLTAINYVLNASERINIEHHPHTGGSLLIQTSESDQSDSLENNDLNIIISDEDSERLLNIFNKISYKEFGNINEDDVDFAQKKLNDLYDTINIINCY